MGNEKEKDLEKGRDETRKDGESQDKKEKGNGIRDANTLSMKSFDDNLRE
jgi:hypothetical protein